MKLRILGTFHPHPPVFAGTAPSHNSPSTCHFHDEGEFLFGRLHTLQGGFQLMDSLVVGKPTTNNTWEIMGMKWKITTVTIRCSWVCLNIVDLHRDYRESANSNWENGNDSQGMECRFLTFSNKPTSKTC